MDKNVTPDKSITEAAFMELYGEQTFKLGSFPKPISLNTALADMDLLCPADPGELENKQARLEYMARRIGPSALAPKHHWLLSPDT